MLCREAAAVFRAGDLETGYIRPDSVRILTESDPASVFVNLAVIHIKKGGKHASSPLEFLIQTL